MYVWTFVCSSTTEYCGDLSTLYLPIYSVPRYVVHPLYLHTINTRQPTMAVLHLTTGNVPFLQIDMQVRTRAMCRACHVYHDMCDVYHVMCATCIMSCVPRVCAGAVFPGAAPHQHPAQLRGHAELAG